MRGVTRLAIGVGAAALLWYTVGLGVYAVSSTRGQASQPRTPDEAREIVRDLGLAEAYPFEPHFAQTPHGRMHYVEAGRGEPILCLHGNPTWSFLYRNFLTGLSDRNRVIAPDLIGFGLSEKPGDPDDYSIEGHVEDVAALVEQLDLRDLTLVLQDWGGPIGLGVAVRHPDRIRALVVMNTIGFVPADDGFPPVGLRVLGAPVIGEQLVQGFGVFNRLVVPAAIARPERKGALVRRAYTALQGSWYERAGVLAFPRLLPRGRDDPLAPLLEAQDRYLRAFGGPVLIAWGMRDPAFGPPILAEWRERFPNAPVLELADASHFLQEDAYERIVPFIRAGLTSSRARGGPGESAR